MAENKPFYEFGLVLILIISRLSQSSGRYQLTYQKALYARRATVVLVIELFGLKLGRSKLSLVMTSDLKFAGYDFEGCLKS